MEILSYSVNYVTRQVVVTTINNDFMKNIDLGIMTVIGYKDDKQVIEGVVPEVFTVEDLKKLIIED